MNSLSFTTALVLLWTDGRIHTSIQARKFLSMLDLSQGMDTMTKCNEFWPHYADLVRNRKSYILRLARDSIDDGTPQVVLLGAGMDALSIELCSHYGQCKIFDVDESYMLEKQRLVDSITPPLAGTLKCIGADVSCPDDVLSGLVANGWNRSLPTLVVVEGLSYYVPYDVLGRLLDEFKTSNQHNRVIFEYLLPREHMSAESVKIVEYCFDLIVGPRGSSGLTRYTSDDLLLQLNMPHARIIKHHTLKQMEREQTGDNSIFNTNMPGWIEICKFVL